MATGRTEGKNGLFAHFLRVWEGFLGGRDFDLTSACGGLGNTEDPGHGEDIYGTRSLSARLNAVVSVP